MSPIIAFGVLLIMLGTCLAAFAFGTPGLFMILFVLTCSAAAWMGASSLACDFVSRLHRHNNPPRGHKFSVGLSIDGALVGVAMAGRPIARHFDNGITLEVNRTCTDGTKNANSMLYGAVGRAAKAMGYKKIITYTQADESGSSLRAAGFRKVKELPARGSWAESSVKLKGIRDDVGNGGTARVLWELV